MNKSGIIKLLMKDYSLSEFGAEAFYNKRGDSLVVYNDKLYLSDEDLCKKLNISLDFFRELVKNGMSVENAVESCKKENSKHIKENKYLKDNSNLSVNDIIELIQKGYNISRDDAIKAYNKHKRTLVIYKGNLYLSKKDLRQSLKISRSMLDYLESAGYSLAEAVDLAMSAKYVKKKNSINRKVTYKGQEYESKWDLCRQLKIKPQIVNTMLDYGFSFDDAVDYAVKGAKYKKTNAKTREDYITYGGVTYRTRSEMCEALGIDKERYDNVRHNMSKEKAIQYCLENKPRNTNGIKKDDYVTYNGVTYKTRHDLCRALNIIDDKFDYVISSKKCSREEAIDYCLRNPKKFMKSRYYNGIPYNTVDDLIKYFALNREQYGDALSLGLNPIEAIDYCNRVKGDRCYIGKKWYRNIDEAYKAYGIPRKDVLIRMQACHENEETAFNNVLENVKYITAFGKKYRTASEICQEYNVKKEDVDYYILKCNMSIDDAIIEAKMNPR